MSSNGAIDKKPWQPHLEAQAEFNPFVSPIAHLGELESPMVEPLPDEEPLAGQELQGIAPQAEPQR